MPTLYIYCGIPGSGKSYHAQNVQKDTCYLSRDAIRFELLQEGDEYFSKEKEVFSTFSGAAALLLQVGHDVICDATHASRGSRKKLIDAIDSYLEGEAKNYEIVCVVFRTPFEVCCERNAKREGMARVPDEAMNSFHKRFQFPRIAEDNRIKSIEVVKWEEEK